MASLSTIIIFTIIYSQYNHHYNHHHCLKQGVLCCAGPLAGQLSGSDQGTHMLVIVPSSSSSSYIAIVIVIHRHHHLSPLSSKYLEYMRFLVVLCPYAFRKYIMLYTASSSPSMYSNHQQSHYFCSRKEKKCWGTI